MHLISLLRKKNHANTNSQMDINFSNQIMNCINMTSLLNDEHCNFPITNMQLSYTYLFN